MAKPTSTAPFALSLLKNEVAAKPGENVLVSPLSVSIALGMTANGARGKTLDGIAKAIGLDGSDLTAANAGFKKLAEQLKRKGLGVTLDIANAIFARQGVAFHDAFLSANKQYFGARVDALDFDSDTARDAINGWVADSTQKKIVKLLDDPIASNTIMFLINAIYFRGEWSVKFDKAETQEADFHTPGGAKKHPLMHRSGDMCYGQEWVKGKEWEQHAYQYVSLPFGDSKSVRMLVYLPGEGKSVDDVLAGIDTRKLVAAAQNEYESDGQLWLPRIDVSYDNSLNESLKKLGMSDAFNSGAADFSGMRPIPPAVFIKDVKHKTVFKVDEEGAEGAAVTSVEVGLECARMPFSVRVDRPFALFVVDSETEAVLFAGVINDPSKS